MKKIYAPWRDNYVKNVAHTKDENTSNNDCIFCGKFKVNDDEKNYILKRTSKIVILFNIYPYNAGHLMLLPLEHKASLNDLDSETRIELMEYMNKSIEILKEVLKPHGFNVGINLGKAGGAGIPSHLHLHIIPRWEGDTNFLPLIGNTKAISFDLKKMFELLKPKFDIISS